MPDSPISNKQLLNILKTRLSTQNLPVFREQETCVIYDEYLDNCKTLMSKAIKRIIIENNELVANLRAVAENCGKIEVDSGKKVKRIPILNNIMADLVYLNQNIDFDEIEPIQGMTSGQRAAVHSLVNQAKGYCKEAFSYGDFSMANTRINDAADILTLAQYIYKGDLVAASKHSDFDTIIREDISSKTWDWMLKNLNGAI